jgi:hypothetical protein
MNIDLEWLKHAALAVGGEEWHRGMVGTAKKLKFNIIQVKRKNVAGLCHPTADISGICLAPHEADQNFIALANPATVLALVERIERAEKIRSNGWIIHLSRWKERIDLIVDPKDRADMTELILKIDQAVMDITARNNS